MSIVAVSHGQVHTAVQHPGAVQGDHFADKTRGVMAVAEIKPAGILHSPASCPDNIRLIIKKFHITKLGILLQNIQIPLHAAEHDGGGWVKVRGLSALAVYGDKVQPCAVATRTIIHFPGTMFQESLKDPVSLLALHGCRPACAQPVIH